MEEQQKNPVSMAVEQALTAESANDATMNDPATVIRQALAKNFIQHCVNAAAADKAENPLVSGSLAAVGEVLAAVLQMGGNEQVQQNIGLIANSISSIGFGQETDLAEQLLIVWAVSANRSSSLNTMLGKMRDAAEADFQQYLRAQLMALQPAPEVAPTADPAPEMVMDEKSEVESQEDLDSAKAESLPVDAVPVSENVPVNEAAPVEA